MFSISWSSSGESVTQIGCFYPSSCTSEGCKYKLLGTAETWRDGGGAYSGIAPGLNASPFQKRVGLGL